ncbi:MAG: TnpV protein [Blautia hansenii]
MRDTIVYRKQDNYLMPNLEQEELPPLGKYGRMRLAYLEEREQQVKYLLLLMKGNLNQDLIETETMAHEKVNQCMKELVKKNPGPKKEENLMGWVGHMNNLKHQAEELVLPEILYR